MRISLTYIIILLFTLSSFSQNSNKEIIFKAMEDELNRSMELKHDNYASPNFISYTLLFQKQYNFVSKQGALFTSDERNSADGTWRLTVGDYQINDENFRNQMSSGNQDVFYEMAVPPAIPEYYGIRNALWVLTNHSYNIAGSNHKSKLELIKKYDLGLDEGILSDFSAEDVISYHKNRKDYLIDKELLEEKTRLYSARALKNPYVKYLSSRINIYQNDYYYLNQEGTQYSYPVDMTKLTVFMKTDFSGENATTGSLSFLAQTPDELPSDEEVIQEIDKLAENLHTLENAEEIKEEYSGPVLYEGNIVGDVFMANLFSFDFSLSARRSDLVLENYNKFYIEDNKNKIQVELGELILPEHLSITSYSRLKEYNGDKLLGAYEVDSEGVKPADSLVLVENGVLRNMFASRIPTTVSDKSTGNRRFVFNNNKIGFRRAPGSLFIRSSQGKTKQQLKAQLLDKAKLENLEFAYIIRTIPGKSTELPANCYRVNVETGEETLVKGAVLRYKLKSNVFRSLAGVSDETIVYNSLNSGNRYSINTINSGNSGLMLSMIIPSALLVDNADIRSINQNKNLNSDLEVISNPLERKN